ncbi:MULTISPECIES: hypothetical protein [unclassified Microbulbifer]|uniref:hypothetical protein n=1 Tax=unclassified Microbulbifer TaxID=2619833 RepID=UPI0027E54989|nr:MULTISPECIES: hypothetical protein [unclassified Microbulbifer]
MAAHLKPTYKEVKSKYEGLRFLSRKLAYETLPPVMRNRLGEAILRDNVSLDGFTLEAQRKLKSWETAGLRRVAWDWEEVTKKYRAHPKRFELSIWFRELNLSGASIGRPTWSGDKLRLDYIESHPLGTPLDGLITDICINAGINYAQSIGAAQIRIVNPVNEAVRNHYLSKPGFSFDERGNFCFMDF